MGFVFDLFRDPCMPFKICHGCMLLSLPYVYHTNPLSSLYIGSSIIVQPFFLRQNFPCWMSQDNEEIAANPRFFVRIKVNQDAEHTLFQCHSGPGRYTKRQVILFTSFIIESSFLLNIECCGQGGSRGQT